MARTPGKDWLVVNRTSSNHLEIAQKIGRKLSPKSFGGGIINYPTAIALDEAKIAVISYAGQCFRFSADWAIDYAYPIANQIPEDTATGINSSMGFAANDSKIAIASWTYHVVRVYNKLTGEKLFQIGNFDDFGNVAESLLYRPSKVLWLDNGNLLVVGHQGRGQGASENGHLTEYDGNDGSFIATRLGYYGDGLSKIGSNICYRPFDAKLVNNKLWVSEYGRNKILKVDPVSWLIEDIYFAPNGTSINAPRALAVTSDGVLVVAAVDGNLVGIDIETRGLTWEIDPLAVGASGDFRDVIEVSPGYLAFTDWASRSLFVVAVSNSVAIAYSSVVVPDGFEVDLNYLPKGFDITTGLLQSTLDENIPDNLVIPLRNKCDG